MTNPWIVALLTALLLPLVLVVLNAYLTRTLDSYRLRRMLVASLAIMAVAATGWLVARALNQDVGYYSFETGTEGWRTDEGEHKVAHLSATIAPVRQGTKSLMVATELFGGAVRKGDIYQHTVAAGYFDQSPPQGWNDAGPYDLTGRAVSCLVYLPTKLAAPNSPRAQVYLFVKDKDSRNHQGVKIDVTRSSAERWLTLSLTVGDARRGEYLDQGFDSKMTNVLGVAVVLPEHSRLVYKGAFYIDDCFVERARWG